MSFAEISKCRVEWRLETPDEWNLTEIKENLENCSHLLRRYFEIEFVYVGSLVIKTLVPQHILNDRDQMKRSVHLFLEKVVEVCKINTDESAIIKVALIVFEESDYQGKMYSDSLLFVLSSLNKKVSTSSTLILMLLL